MTFSARLQRLLLIRDHETTLVSRLFAFEFFQGISIAVFFYCTITIFLEHLSTENLPYVFILSAFLLWIFGMLYSAFEHKLATKRLILGVILFNTALILILRFGLVYHPPMWFYYCMLGSYNVAYLLSNLEFWGVAAVLFDVRQSKRLFSIVSAGDIPAKFIGYLASAFLGHYLGMENLLWIAFGSSILSIYFFQQLEKTGALNHHHHHHNSHGHSNHDHAHDNNPMIIQAMNIFRGNTLVRQAAFISFFSYTAFILLNFIFFGYVKEAAHEHGSSLPLFIGIFLALSRLVTLIIKLTVTNRLADRLGIRNALLITPIILLVLCLFALPATFFGSLNLVFYTFAAIAIITDVLRSSIQFPVLLAAMQPLPVKERLGGHTVIKGIIDPFAFLSVGAVLIISFAIHPHLDYRVMTMLLFLLVVGCIISVLRFDKNYVEVLQIAIRNRSIRHREVMISDRESIQILKQKISDGEPGEVILALHLMKSQPQQVQQEMLATAMHHSSALVQCEAISLVKEWHVENALPDVKEMLHHETDAEVLVQSISVLAVMDETFDYVQFLFHTNPDVAMAAMLHSLNKKDSSFEKAHQLLISWVQSQEVSLRAQAARTLGALTDDIFHPMLIELLHDSNEEVKKAAIFAAGKQRNSILNEELLKMLSDQPRHQVILDALRFQGGVIVEPVINFILNSGDDALRGKMIALLGKVSDERAHLALDRLADDLPSMRQMIFKTMNSSGFKASHQLKTKYQKFIRDSLGSAVQIVYLMKYLESMKADPVLLEALQLELNSVRDDLMQLFSFLYDPVSIKKATAGIKMNTGESISTSLEIIMVSVSHEFAKEFIILFEPTPLDHKWRELRSHYPEPHLTKMLVCETILRDRHHQFNAWSKSCVMYFMKDELKHGDRGAIEQLVHSPNPLLRETSAWLLNFVTGKSTGPSLVTS